MARATEDLVRRLQRIGALGDAASLLHWDQQTMMPPGGVEARSRELATLSTLAHELFVAPELERLLGEAEREARDDDERALVRETRLAYDRATRVPGELVEALAKATSRALPVWAEAKAQADFGRFRLAFEEIVELRRQYAEHVDPEAPAYGALFQDYEPWLGLEPSRANLLELRAGVEDLLATAPSDHEGASPFEGTWPAERQAALCQRVLDLLGYDRDHGRLDRSAHPFTAGNPYDCRITTRYDEADPLSALSSTIHEFGHALYTLGLPREHHGTPLGEARDLVVHESQSRLWENHVGRSRPFWQLIAPLVGQAFPERAASLDVEEAWRAANRVGPTLVRVDADELTYHLHIALRFEIEEALFAGRLEVAEIPQAWNEGMEASLGITPPDDAKGCLQDVHWAHGAFGYFPTYSLGSMLAAQLWAAFERAEGPADDAIREGRFEGLRGWLGDTIHRHGKRFTTPELVERATGGPLTPEAFLAYAEAKFSRVWS